MSLSDRSRRGALAALLTATLSLAACGFTPAYAPNGAANSLQNAVLTFEPDTRQEYLLVQRLEERLGRPVSPTYALDVALTIESTGTAQSGGATRSQITGKATFALKRIGTKVILTEGRVETFTGYSTTGSTVSERAARSAAEERLMVILADQIVDRLILAAPDLP
ncbi:LPS assembly lipoprotein LptE [Pseudaestuariivita atlantica]|uniref:Lipoprotein n=1 Tax=Pseudaestuariivita atlantica TaxID=1317121 RepID=A0A0L1JP59_9RHOB|nr:LPS assembly lipoprotein LptE [Pseudaestuariivita atlantica]KNG93511.1 hypothetical protein ATO11_09830 [Pseudaestuariivita atlantica]